MIGRGRQSEVSDPPLVEMSPIETKGKQKAIDDDVLPLDDLEKAANYGSLSKPSSNSGSDSDSDSESDFGAKPEAGSKEDPPLSRDDLLAYLENMRQRFSKKSTADSFADQEEEVLIVTSNHK